MQIVPVIDLKGGIVVHARRGQRADYAPLLSPLVDGCEPVAVARALCAAANATTLYVADLDAIGGAPADVETLSALSAVAELWVDAGAITRERALTLAAAGVTRNVVGTESLGSGAVDDMDAPPRVLSVDLRDGRLISPRPDLAGPGLALARGIGDVGHQHQVFLASAFRNAYIAFLNHLEKSSEVHVQAAEIKR